MTNLAKGVPKVKLMAPLAVRQVLGSPSHAAGQLPLLVALGSIEFVLGLPDAVLGALHNCWDGEYHRRLHGVVGGAGLMDLVPLHVTLVDHILRGHTHCVDEGGNALVGGLPCHVLPSKTDSGLLPLEQDPCILDHPTLHLLTNGSNGLCIVLLESLKLPVELVGGLVVPEAPAGSVETYARNSITYLEAFSSVASISRSLQVIAASSLSRAKTLAAPPKFDSCSTARKALLPLFQAAEVLVRNQSALASQTLIPAFTLRCSWLT